MRAQSIISMAKTGSKIRFSSSTFEMSRSPIYLISYIEKRISKEYIELALKNEGNCSITGLPRSQIQEFLYIVIYCLPIYLQSQMADEIFLHSPPPPQNTVANMGMCQADLTAGPCTENMVRRGPPSVSPSKVCLSFNKQLCQRASPSLDSPYSVSEQRYKVQPFRPNTRQSSPSLILG